jgi:3'-phosphoadenosine 5'-phosphosulfate sulfotransferase (PAPS reductase)/FAD synthetase
MLRIAKRQVIRAYLTRSPFEAEAEPVTEFFDLSGGMESAAMICLEADRIKRDGCIVRYADTGKQFPEMEDSLRQIETILGIAIERITPRISFDDFLFDRGGMIRKGTNDCSRRMKRGNLAEERKGHSFMPLPLKVLDERRNDDGLFANIGCACFGGTESVADEIEEAC